MLYVCEADIEAGDLGQEQGDVVHFTDKVCDSEAQDDVLARYGCRHIGIDQHIPPNLDMVDALYQFVVFGGQVVVGIDILNHQVLLHTKQNGSAQRIERHQVSFCKRVISMAVSD